MPNLHDFFNAQLLGFGYGVLLISRYLDTGAYYVVNVFYVAAEFLTVGNIMQINVNNDTTQHFPSNLINAGDMKRCLLLGRNTFAARPIPIEEPGPTVAMIKYLLQTLFVVLYILFLIIVTLTPFAINYWVFNRTFLHSLFGDVLIHIVHYAMIVNAVITANEISSGFTGFNPITGKFNHFKMKLKYFFKESGSLTEDLGKPQVM